MTYQRPSFRHPKSAKNALGYGKEYYEGVVSTLCAGCGHDSITGAIVQACFEIDLEPHLLVKLSGIGCSSKTPAYFLSNSHGFNSVHGRMPSISTGANLANKELIYLGVSGDGDTASIGIGQFVHVVRRNLNMVYIVMNNGCYGLTKGQDSATADFGSVSKKGSNNPFEPIDLVSLVVELGATFVGRSFSGDRDQLVPMIKAAMKHSGFAFIDILSPCVTFNNNKASTKSYDFVREHLKATSTLDYIPKEKEITVGYEDGKTMSVELFDGSKIVLRKIDNGWDFNDRFSSIRRMQKARLEGEILTGLMYIDPDTKDLHHTINTVDKPLNKLSQKELCPGVEVLEMINKGYR